MFAFCEMRNCPKVHSSLTIEWPRVRKEAFKSRRNLSMRLAYCRRVIPGSPPEMRLMKFMNASSIWQVSLIAATHSRQGRLSSRTSRKLRHSAMRMSGSALCKPLGIAFAAVAQTDPRARAVQAAWLMSLTSVSMRTASVNLTPAVPYHTPIRGSLSTPEYCFF